MGNIQLKIVINILLTLLTGAILLAQESDSLLMQVNDSLLIEDTGEAFNEDYLLSNANLPVDSLFSGQDTTLVAGDSIAADTLQTSGGLGDAITTEVNYDAADSIIFSMNGGTAELYGSAIITYGEIKLESDYIKYEMNKSEVLAYGLPDSTGKVMNKPIFSDGGDSYEANSLRYNFKSKRGFIEEVITEQEGGYLHSEETKMQKNGHIHIKNGKYTTCDAPHPHFYVAITKGISMPGDKIISGPAYLVFQDIPLPIGIPFGFFPNSQTKTSGILIPQYGEEERRGFYLRDGGYYFALNEYLDLRITGDIYSNGTWGVRAASNYKLRYKFNGNVNVQYFNNVSGYKIAEDAYSVSKDYSIGWNHSQAREASPNSSFRASVNLSSSSYDQNHTRNIQNVVQNTKQSSVSYSKSWPNSPFNFSASLNHSQNSNTNAVNMTLPKLSLNMGRIKPFERKKKVGPKKWYEDIQLSYSSIGENRIKTTDTMLFTSEVWNDMSNGFKHEVPLSLNIKPFKKVAALQSMTITPNVSYKGIIYSSYTEKFVSDYTEEEVDGVTVFTPVVSDTIHNRLSYAQAYLPRISTGVSPKIYGMYQFTGDGRLEAIRHMMTPSASISYTPDMTGIQADYYRDVIDTINDNNILETYSIYEDQIYGTPTFNGAAGSINLSLKNNLEAKVRSKNDTIDEVSKVKLLDNFNFSTNYNLFNRDSLAPSWSAINMNGNTRLFNNKLSLNFRGTMDPFGYDSTRSRTTQSYFAQTGKLVRLTTASVNLGISFKSKQDDGDKDNKDDIDDPLSSSAFDETNNINNSNQYDPAADDYYGQYVDFDVPWSLKLDYSFSYRKQTDISSIVQTVRASGDLSLTPKWKIGFNTGYDIYSKKFTTTNISLYRDLHCWEMRISVVPFGNYKSYNFQINAKSNILSDLKYNKRKSWQDNF